MTPRLLAQIAWVAVHDAEGLRRDYEWPPVEPTEEERAEADRLEAMADELIDRAALESSGKNAVFGGVL